MKTLSLLKKLAVAAVIAAAAGAVIFLVYTLQLRTDYRETALQVNDAALAGLDNAKISRGDISFEVSREAVDYYNKFLLDAHTLVYSRKGTQENEKTIILKLGEAELSFTGLEDGSAIAVHWDSGAEQKVFRVRSQITFSHLEAYFENCRRKAGA